MKLKITIIFLLMGILSLISTGCKRVKQASTAKHPARVEILHKIGECNPLDLSSFTILSKVFTIDNNQNPVAYSKEKFNKNDMKSTGIGGGTQYIEPKVPESGNFYSRYYHNRALQQRSRLLLFRLRSRNKIKALLLRNIYHSKFEKYKDPRPCRTRLL